MSPPQAAHPTAKKGTFLGVVAALMVLGLAPLAVPPAGATSHVPGLEVVLRGGGRVDWSATGDLIAYDQLEADGYFDVYQMRSDGTGKVCLTCDHPDLPNRMIGNPAWHPSGRYLVFQAEKAVHPGSSAYAQPGAGAYSDLWVLDLSTNRATLVRATPNTLDSGVLHPHFSHDGTQLSWSELYERASFTPGQEFGLWALHVADFSESPPRLSNIQTLEPAGTRAFYENHGFSPDDRRLTFSKGPGVGEGISAVTRMDIVSYDLVNGTVVTLTSEDYNEHGTVSPDGQSIVWMSGVGTPSGTEFWLMNADGSGKQQLTCMNTPGHPHYLGDTAIAADSSWSPSGDRFVAKVSLGVTLSSEELIVLVRLDRLTPGSCVPPPPKGCPGFTPAATWVPAGYNDLMDELSARMESFDYTVHARWNGTRYPVAYAAELSSATTHRGRDLLNVSNYWGVLLELDALAGLGLRAVALSVSFPVLDPNFTTDPGEYQGYVDFYRQLVGDIHARGMQVIIDSSELFPEYTSLPVQGYYDNLTYAEYLQGRFETLRTIARDIQPDWLGMGSEPDTEAMLTGQPVDTPVAWAAQMEYFVTALGVEGLTAVPLGGGIGTWDPAYVDYTTRLARDTNLSWIDVHVYPINYDLLERVLTIVDIARAWGKDVGMTEAWLYKARDAELSLGVTYGAIFSRDAYSFFAPLDARFFRMMVNLSHLVRFDFQSFFWEKYFFAYLDYNDTWFLPPTQVQFLGNVAAVAAMVAGNYSDAGWALALAIDYTPPTVPGNVGAQALDDDRIQVTWTASTENWGAPCYRIFRNGVEIGLVTGTSYTDGGRSPATTYTYTIVALDFAGNPSGSSAAATATTEEIPNVPPSAGFAFEPAGPMAGTAVNFTDTSVDADGTIHSWVWDFGDGNASTDRNPPHAYAAAGNYTVTLTVTDNRGGIDSESRVVTVAEIPTTPPPDGRIGGGLGLLALILAILAVILLAFFLLRRRRPAAATLPRPGNLP